MNFSIKSKVEKYSKDILNDKENDMNILKIQRNFVYYESPQSTIDFKDRFDIGKIIGQGAYASVREAFDKKNNQKVAIKIYQKEKLKEGQRLRGIRREVSILILLRNIRGIGRLIDLVETRNHINLIMEFCEGKDIYRCIKSKEK